MRDPALTALTALLGVALVAVHVAAKQKPKPEDMARLASRQQQNAAWQGKTAAEFELHTLDGGTFRLSDAVGKEVIVLNFFATWCAPCVAEMPELERLADEMRGRPFRLLAIDSEEKPDVVRAFLGEHGLGLPVALDESGSVGSTYGVDSLPTTVVIGPDGKIRLYQVGPVLNTEVAFGDLLRAAFSEIAEGKGTSREAFLAAQDHTGGAGVRPAVLPLRGRPGRIAAAMRCPCGCCEHTVADCVCVTAQAVRKRLVAAPLEHRADDEVIRSLEGEFSPKSP